MDDAGSLRAIQSHRKRWATRRAHLALAGAVPALVLAAARRVLAGRGFERRNDRHVIEAYVGAVVETDRDALAAARMVVKDAGEEGR